MTSHPGKPKCCIRNINMDYNNTFTASYTARSNYSNPDNYSDINKGHTSVDVSIRDTGPEVDFNKEAKGDESGDLPQDVKDAALEDWKDNPDKWFKDDDYGNDSKGPSETANDHGEENWDEIAELTGGSLNKQYTHGPDNPYTKNFKTPIRRMSRPAEFCGDKFMGWMDSNQSPL